MNETDLHRLLMPPHPGNVYHSSALCTCGKWQYDSRSFHTLTQDYVDVLRVHTTHVREFIRQEKENR